MLTRRTKIKEIVFLGAMWVFYSLLLFFSKKEKRK